MKRSAVDGAWSHRSDVEEQAPPPPRKAKKTERRRQRREEEDDGLCEPTAEEVAYRLWGEEPPEGWIGSCEELASELHVCTSETDPHYDEVQEHWYVPHRCQSKQP
jgi:hypothetical protein